MKATTISIIIPTYNEEETIEKIINKVLKSDVLGLKKEIIIVDDGSTDKTTQIINKTYTKSVKKILFPKNKGKGFALRAGFKQATGDIILVQDADLEYHPKDYPKIIKPFINENANVVYGSRELSGNNKHSSIFFHMGGRTVTFFTNLLYGSKLTDVPTGYKVFKREVLINIPLKCRGFEFCPEVTANILKKQISIMEVPITYSARHRKDGKKIKWFDGLEALWTLFRIKFDL